VDIEVFILQEEKGKMKTSISTIFVRKRRRVK
jgi:hypothetical protein